jgi:hypothetical protein
VIETTACYRETNGVYFTRNVHRLDCADPDCRGCRPCPEPRHCSAKANCTWHVAEGQLTCGRCLAAARRDLRWIAALASLMLPAAVGAGVDSEAANLAGPTADPEAWTWRKVAARQGLAWHISLIEDDDEYHPHAVIGIWARMLTEDYGHDMPEQATLTWCAAYVDRTLARVAHDDEQDFPQLARELRKCRQHLEAVLRNDDKPEKGAPCPTCRDAGAIHRLRREYSHWCEDSDCEALHFSTRFDADLCEDVPDDSADVWRCPSNPEHWWTQQGYADLLEDRKVRSA